jgi:hypothetical protein
MKKILVLLSIIFSSFFSAHQIDLASIIFSKTDDGKVIVQITSSLTAFQTEVNYNNEENSYATPEEFRQLVIKHFQKNFSFVVNDTSLKFKNTIVILGHETKIVTEVVGMPKNIHSISIKNEIFKDIHNNQSVVIFALAGFPENQNFEINKDRAYQLHFKLIDGNWQLITKEDSERNYTYVIFGLMVLAIIILAVLLLVKKKQKTIDIFN